MIINAKDTESNPTPNVKNTGIKIGNALVIDLASLSRLFNLAAIRLTLAANCPRT